MAQITGINLLASIMDSTGITPNALLQSTLSAKLQQMIDNGTYSKLAAAIATSGFSTEINAATEISALSDSVEANKVLIEAAADEAAVATIDFSSTNTIEDIPIANEEITTNPALFSKIDYSFGTTSTLNSQGVDSLDSQTHWNSSLSTITYSFNDTAPSYNNYDDPTKLTQGFTPLNEEQRTTVRTITQELNKLLGIELQEETSGDGLIRLNIVDIDDENPNDNSITAGFAFPPGESPEYGGDMFLNSLYNDSDTTFDFDLTQGKGGWSTIVHELGHALGLKHPGNYSSGDEPPFLSTDLDNTAHTVMSYTEVNYYEPKFVLKASGSLSWSFDSINPQLYSIYDVSTLQAIYGVNTTTNNGDDTYTFSYSDFKYDTIWDTGGNDTFDLSTNSGDTTVNLNSGSLNSIDQYSFDDIVTYFQTEVDYPYHNSNIENALNDASVKDDLYTGENNIGIAEGVIIENINTGSGNDTITDNEVDNTINTAAGDDSIYVGNGGYDTVDGGDGTDTLYIDLLRSDVTVEVSGSGYLMYSDSYAVQFDNIASVSFSDGVYAPDVLIA